MKPIIDSIPVEILEKELTDDKFVRNTTKGNNKIYIVAHHDSPNLMLEIGRLREIAFRKEGGGTGKDADIDSYDTAEIPYKQLIVWDSVEKEITGGYRYIKLNSIPKNENANIHLATSSSFQFSDEFVENYLPYTIELGRSFVQPKYQATKAGRKALYALDNLWDGLGSLIIDHPEIKYFFGQVTMYTYFNLRARDMILFFLDKFFSGKNNLLRPHKPVLIQTDFKELEKLFSKKTYAENYKTLSLKVRELGEVIPPLINAYMGLSSTMCTFGTALNDHIDGIEETAILIKHADIYDKKKNRHLSTYVSRKI